MLDDMLTLVDLEHKLPPGSTPEQVRSPLARLEKAATHESYVAERLSSEPKSEEFYRIGRFARRWKSVKNRYARRAGQILAVLKRWLAFECFDEALQKVSAQIVCLSGRSKSRIAHFSQPQALDSMSTP